MRFITEFELDVPFSNKEADKCKSTMGFHIGGLIANAFDWHSAPFLSMVGPHRNKWALEIEAFPMDKWVEFKNSLHVELLAHKPDHIRILELIKELESFGKHKEETTPQDLKKCPHCNNPASSELHTCPYKEDVNNGSISECYCCEKCTHECAMDI